MRTRYLRIRGPARAPHVPKGPPLAQPSGHPPSRPGPVGPAARVAGGHAESMRQVAGGGDIITPHLSFRGLTAESKLACSSCVSYLAIPGIRSLAYAQSAPVAGAVGETSHSTYAISVK